MSVSFPASLAEASTLYAVLRKTKQLKGHIHGKFSTPVVCNFMPHMQTTKYFSMHFSKGHCDHPS